MSDIIKIGTQDATFKVGSSAVTAAYLGSTQVYPQGEPPTPVGFKYKLTLSNGDIVSAETDATSAITRNEVSAYSATCVSAEIGDTVTSIGASTFNGFNNLSSVTIGTNVTTINVYAFNRCSGLTEVVIPDSVTYIGGSAFDNCKSISSITLSNNITQIGMGAFRSCLSLQNIVIPSSVTSIEGQAFLFDSSLTAITVNATTPPTLGSDVFLETGNCPIYCPCQSLSLYQQNWSEYASRLACIPTPSFKYKLTLSDSSVVSAACDGTSAITSNEISAYSESCVSAEINDCVTNIDASAFLSFTNIRNISLPDSLTTIGDYAFYHCTKLTGLTIPSGVTAIGQQILAFTENISSLTVNATTPPSLGTNALGNKIYPIYVPCDCVNTYKQASGWASYSSRISCIPAPTYKWVSYTTGDTVPATTAYGVKLYANYDEGYNVIFSGTTGDYIKFHPNGDFGQWSAEDENGNSISISSYFIPGSMMYTIEFSDLGLGGMNIISPSTFEDDIDLYVTN